MVVKEHFRSGYKYLKSIQSIFTIDTNMRLYQTHVDNQFFFIYRKVYFVNGYEKSDYQ